MPLPSPWTQIDGLTSPRLWTEIPLPSRMCVACCGFLFSHQAASSENRSKEGPKTSKNAMDEFMMSKDLPFRPGVQEVLSLLKLQVELDTSSPESSDKVVSALRAAAEFTGAPVRKCILIAGSLPGFRGSERVGMPCIVVWNSFTSRADIPSISAVVMDGCGEPDLTISRLQRRKWY